MYEKLFATLPRTPPSVEFAEAEAQLAERLAKAGQTEETIRLLDEFLGHARTVAMPETNKAAY